MKRVMLFAKGNVDVHDSLHSCRIGGQISFNGINDVLRVTHPGVTVRLKHETFNRSDALLQATGVVPESIAKRGLPLGTYPPASQFSRATIETKADAIILSIQPDIASMLVRHKREGYVLYPNDSAHWSADDKEWLKSEFEHVPDLTAEQSMANLTTIVGQIREHSQAPVLIYNLSPIMPGEAIHCYQGFEGIYSTAIRRFNLGLIELSEQTGISIVDVDSIVARKGSDALKIDAVHLTPAGYKLVAEEVVRILDDLGVLSEAGA